MCKIHVLYSLVGDLLELAIDDGLTTLPGEILLDLNEWNRLFSQSEVGELEVGEDLEVGGDPEVGGVEELGLMK